MGRMVNSVLTKVVVATTLISCLFIVSALAAEEVKKVKVALGDIVTVETLHFAIAIEHAKERGVDIEIIPFKSEDIANQAIVNAQAHIGVGTPYAVIQKIAEPIRIFYQLSTLLFFPVVNKKYYKSWKDLDGEEIVVHSRTSGTLALANLMALKEGIKYKNISYVPGSEVRALAMLKGTIKATYLDAFNKNFLLKKAPGQFLVLPAGEATASDECLFARVDFINSNPKVVRILLEELLKVWRRVNADPFYVVDERARLGLLPDLPKDLEKEVLPFFVLGAEGGMFPPNGGDEEAARKDLEFFTVAGQLKGPAKDLAVKDFWYLDPLKEVLKDMGRVEIKFTSSK